MVNLCLHLTSKKVPPANVAIITPYKEHMDKSFKPRGTFTYKDVIRKVAGQQNKLKCLAIFPHQQEGEELECEGVKFLEMTIYQYTF